MILTVIVAIDAVLITAAVVGSVATAAAIKQFYLENEQF